MKFVVYRGKIYKSTQIIDYTSGSVYVTLMTYFYLKFALKYAL